MSIRLSKVGTFSVTERLSEEVGLSQDLNGERQLKIGGNRTREEWEPTQRGTRSYHVYEAEKGWTGLIWKKGNTSG